MSSLAVLGMVACIPPRTLDVKLFYYLRTSPLVLVPLGSLYCDEDHRNAVPPHGNPPYSFLHPDLFYLYSASFICQFTLFKNLTQRRKGAKKGNKEKLWQFPALLNAVNAIS